MYKLILKPDLGESFSINLKTYDNSVLDVYNEDINKVYSDMCYSLEISGVEKEIRNVTVYVNDNRVNTIYTNDKLIISPEERQLFSDCFGFAKISVDLFFGHGEEVLLFSDFVSIMLKDKGITRKVNSMYEYVLGNKEMLLYSYNIDSSDKKVNKGENNKGIISRLKLAEDIAWYYQKNFGYFKVNARAKTTEKYSVDNIEKAVKVDNRTLEYVATHPEELTYGSGSAGISIDGKKYYPKKALIPLNQLSIDIYENRILLSFLPKIISDLQSLNKELLGNFKKVPDYSETDGYVQSAGAILTQTEEIIKEQLEKVLKLIDKFKFIYHMYDSVFNVKHVEINNPPKPTPLFLSVPVYNIGYSNILKWLDYKEMEYSEESMILSLVSVSSLYEFFVLCRMVNSIEDKGYTLKLSENYSYKMNDNSLYKNCECVNIFIFEKEDKELTLFYQPVIYAGANENNITGLYRNTSICFGENNYRGSYYVPDFLIRVTDSSKSNFYIMDAKFMSRSGALKKIPELSFKYLFSVSTEKSEDVIKGLYVLYGKANYGESKGTVYDYAIGGRSEKTKPSVMYIPVSDDNLK